MKRAYKRIFGLLGLAIVAITTIFAANLPSPEALAISSVTDTIVVRVVGAVPDVNLTSPEQGSITVTPEQTIKFDYENVETVTLTVKYTDADGTVHEYTLETYDTDYQAGSITYALDMSGANFGYGEYVVTVTGEGYEGVTDEDSIAFSYYPVYGTVEEDENTGDIYLDLEYDADDGTGTGTGEVAEVQINVYDEAGNLVEGLSPITVTPPTTQVELPLADYGLASGTYTIEIIAYNSNGEELYKAFYTYVSYEAIPVPDTGKLFKNLNISRTDYLITGFLIFFAFGIFGLLFIAKRQKRSTRRRH